MSIYHVLRVFKMAVSPTSIGRFFAFIVAAVFLAGCSSTMTRVQTWDGDAAEGGTALLEAPGEIRVAKVNGRNMGNFLMDDLALNYDLLPGENQVVFSYKTIWAKAGVVRNGESKVHVVQTEPHAVTFTAQAGETYRFDFDKPDSRREAEALREDFSGVIVNEAGEEVARFEPWDGESVVAASPARTPVSGDASATADAVDGNTLEQLKALWHKASEEEKRTFLRWAFE
ncbi:DUF2057 family protein [Marinobacter sp. DUT-3]|uniref:DUF2057 family protein n=1 Tax=Marinobacter sp. DUT-3 TaxID=3412036 RepID=UPI003D172E18